MWMLIAMTTQTARRAAREGHALDSWRHVHDGIRGLLSRGATGPRGHGRRVLDGRAPGHRRRVPSVREGDRSRHAGGAPARPGGLSGRRSRRCSCPERSSSTRRAARSTSTTTATGGRTSPAPAGCTPRARKRHEWPRPAPRTHVAWEDVEAYARWAGKELPTEAEWEYAARGGLEGKVFTWGDEFKPRGRMMANTWQGEFPWQNLLEDRYERTSPVKSFPPERLRPVRHGRQRVGVDDRLLHAAPQRRDDPRVLRASGKPARHVARPELQRRPPGEQFPRRVVKGGSHLCAPNYCLRYRPAARQAQSIETSMGHLGFRCIVRPN